MPTRRRRHDFKTEVLPQACEAARAAHPECAIELWTMDEHRLGLIPILRRVWAPRGRRPTAVVRVRYEWLWVLAFVHPATGRTSWWLLPVLNAGAFALVLRAFAQEQGAGTDKHLLLVLDGAGWHTGAQVRAPPGVDLLFQPAYSPEVQPAEHLWTLLDEEVVNRSFETLPLLEQVIAARCCQLAEQTDLVRGTTRFHWWPDDP